MKLVPYRPEPPPAPVAFLQSLQEVREFAEIVLQSEMFKDVKSAAQAVVKIARGRELGLGPMESLSSLHVVEGKVTMSAQLMAALAQRAGFRYKVTELTDQICRLMWFDADGEQLGPSEFTMHDAHRAGLARRQNWRKYPKAMLQARALAAGARLYAAAALLGVYDPDELAQDPQPYAPSPQVLQVDASDPAQANAPALKTLQHQEQETPAPKVANPATPQGASGGGLTLESLSLESSPLDEPDSSATPKAPAQPVAAGQHPGKLWSEANMRIRNIAQERGFRIEELRLIIRHVYEAESSSALSAQELKDMGDALEEGHSDRDESWLSFAIRIMEKAEYTPEIIKQAYVEAQTRVWRVLLLSRHLQARAA